MLSITLATPAGPLYGTLLIPPGNDTRWPVALLIAGSGPTDRDGNSGPSVTNNSLEFLAEGLAEHGIASLRYDKRGVGASRAALAAEDKIRFSDYVDDAAGWIAMLRADTRFSTVLVIGHSEGSLLGMIAAAREPRADGFVSINGAGRPLPDVLREQLTRDSPDDPLTIEALAELDTLVAGHHITNVDPRLMMLFRPSVQDYLLSVISIDPAKEIARLEVPILVVSGTTDIQVSVADGDTLMRAAHGAQRLIITDMNHVLKSVPSRALDQQLPVYSDPIKPVVPELIDGVSRFIKRLAPSTSG